MKTIAITQPTFMPWLGYFDLIAQAESFVFLDDVQFEKQSWQSRNRVRTKSGDLIWLSVPIKKAPLATKICAIEISEGNGVWRKKIFRSIEQNLSKAPYWEECEEFLRSVLLEKIQDSLAELNMEFIREVAKKLAPSTELLRCSNLNAQRAREEKLLSLCEKLGAERYYSNAGSAVYLEEEREKFESRGIRLEFQKWSHPEYRQNGPGFVSHLSVVDALACLGWDELKKTVPGRKTI